MLASSFVAQPAHAADGGVSIVKPWMRFIIAARPAAGYFTLQNGTEHARVIVGASSPACGMVMLHRSMTKDGSNGMADVGSLTVAPGQSVTFEPGGYHLMCMSPVADMKERDSVPVTLTFKDGSSVSADFAVRGAAGQ